MFSTRFTVPPFCSFPWYFIAEHHAIWSGISLWSVGVWSLSCIFSQLFASQISSLWMNLEKRKCLDYVQALFSNCQNICVINSFSHKFRAQHHPGCYEESLSLPGTVHPIIFFSTCQLKRHTRISLLVQ